MYYNNKLDSIKSQHKKELEDNTQREVEEIAAINTKFDNRISGVEEDDLLQEEQKKINIQMYESNRQDVIRKKSAEFTTSRNEINVRYKEEIGRINDSIAMVRQLGEKNEDSSVIFGTDDCPPSPSSEMRQIHDRIAKLQLEAPIYYNNKLESIKAQHKRDLEEVNQYQNREIAAINQKWDDQISMIQTNDLMQEEQKMMNIQMYESSREDEVERMKTYCQNLTTNHQKREIDEVNSYWNNQLVNIQSDSDMPQNQKELRIRSIGD